MPLQYFAGQKLTADALQRATTYRVVQNDSQSVASSTTLVDSNIVINVDDLMEIRLSARYEMDGGGIRWAWDDSGTISLEARDIVSAGDNTTAGPSLIDHMRHRTILTIGEVQTVADFSSATSFLIEERLVVSGSGTITFQFAQQASNAGETVLFPQSYASVTYLGPDV